MDKLKKFGLMEKIVNELNDLKNSQHALVAKLGKIEVDNIELGDSKLEDELPKMHQRVSKNLDTIAEILDYFSLKTDKFSEKNNIEALKEQELIKNI